MAATSSPQPLAVGEVMQRTTETTTNNNQKQLYADLFRPKQAAPNLSKVELAAVTIVHGEPTIEFSMDEVNQFSREEGLHQAVIMKFSYGKPDLQEFRKVFPSQFDTQGRCNIGLLDFRHVLVRFDLYNDFVQCISKSTGYIKAKGEDFFFRTFPWTLGFNPKEETSMAVVWISFPGLPPNLFAKKSLMSIASAVGKPIALDKATQDRTRPSTARVKVILDLLEKHPKRIKILIFDRGTGKSIVQYQEVVYDNLPKYCTFCKHQGHGDKECRYLKEQGVDEMTKNKATDESNLLEIDVSVTEQLQGDARDYLNSKKARQGAKQVAAVDEKIMEDGQGTNDVANNNPKIAEETNRVAMENTVEDVSNLDKGPLTILESTLATVSQGFNVQNAVQIIDPVGDFSTTMTKGDKSLHLDQKEVKDAGHFSCVIGNVTKQSHGIVGSLEQFKDVGHVSPLNFQHEKEKHDAGKEQNNNEFNLKTSGTHATIAFGNFSELKTQQHTIANANQRENEKVGSLEQFKFKQVGHVHHDVDMDKNGNPMVFTNIIMDGVPHVSPLGINYSSSNRECLSDLQIFDAGKEKLNAQSLTCVVGPLEINHDKEIGLVGRKIDQQHAQSFLTVDHVNIGNFNATIANNSGQIAEEENVAKVENVTSTIGNLKSQLVSVQAHSSNAPTLHFSNPNVERIIKDAQHEMMMKETMVQQPLVALNTSVYDVPSNSVESFGDYGGESEQLMISTGNNNEVHEKQESARKASYSDCKAVTSSKRRSYRSRKN